MKDGVKKLSVTKVSATGDLCHIRVIWAGIPSPHGRSRRCCARARNG